MSLRDVEASTAALAESLQNPEYATVISQVSDIETKGRAPSIYRLHALSIVYRRDIRDLLLLYCDSLGQEAPQLGISKPARTHQVTVLDAAQQLEIPTLFDPKFDLKSTMNLERVVERWGVVPFAFLKGLANDSFIYGSVGDEDYRMYPLILPGSFLQIDPRKNEITGGPWRSEFERPVYWLEARDGYLFGWCSRDEKGWISVHAHSLSNIPSKRLRHPQEVEVVGQVVGVAMRLDAGLPGATSEVLPPKL